MDYYKDTEISDNKQQPNYDDGFYASNDYGETAETKQQPNYDDGFYASNDYGETAETMSNGVGELGKPYDGVLTAGVVVPPDTYKIAYNIWLLSFPAVIMVVFVVLMLGTFIALDGKMALLWPAVQVIIYLAILALSYALTIPRRVTRTTDGFEMTSTLLTYRLRFDEIVSIQQIGVCESSWKCDMVRGGATTLKPIVYIKSNRCCKSMMFNPVVGADEFVTQNQCHITRPVISVV
eukprot:GHVS01096333.1.p1 GENE.GHVS01096333.1~~GHVS01096333.1.p1  ORF type:complete len:236 (+),score=20.33 GHVS01096333.1:357-1064(+)